MAATAGAKILKQDTKEYLTTALLMLLKTEKLSNITISLLCSKAGVSRMAFYRNFAALEQILWEYYKEKLQLSFERRHDINFQFNFFEQFGEELMLAERGGYEPIIRAIFIEQVILLYGEEDYSTVFIAAGAYAVWRKWLLEGKSLPLEEVQQILAKFHEVALKK